MCRYPYGSKHCLRRYGWPPKSYPKYFLRRHLDPKGLYIYIYMGILWHISRIWVYDMYHYVSHLWLYTSCLSIESMAHLWVKWWFAISPPEIPRGSVANTTMIQGGRRLLETTWLDGQAWLWDEAFKIPSGNLSHSYWKWWFIAV